MKVCKEESCQRPSHARGYCPSHWNQWRRWGFVKPIRARSIHDECSYHAAHDRLHKQWGSASQYGCIACPKTATDWAYDGTDPSQLYNQTSWGKGRALSWVFYSRYPEFYMPMCRRCHRARDLHLAFAELHEYREWKHRTGLTLPQIEAQIREKL